jgi:hypothetical protein
MNEKMAEALAYRRGARSDAFHKIHEVDDLKKRALLEAGLLQIRIAARCLIEKESEPNRATLNYLVNAAWGLEDMLRAGGVLLIEPGKAPEKDPLPPPTAIVAVPIHGGGSVSLAAAMEVIRVYREFIQGEHDKGRISKARADVLLGLKVPEQEPEDDGTGGQDRANYTDDQDRENYTPDDEKSPDVWLNVGEDEGAAACGCRLVKDYQASGPALFLCDHHDRRGGAKKC